MTKQKALSKAINVSVSEAKDLIESGDYLVLTDEEADEQAKKYILDSIWSFNSDFIIEHSSALDYDDASHQVVKAIGEQCESGNEAMKKLIDDLDEFVEDAIDADGRGHFMSSYDGEEIEEGEYFIYRIN
jgi:hypothetical protein